MPAAGNGVLCRTGIAASSTGESMKQLSRSRNSASKASRDVIDRRNFGSGDDQAATKYAVLPTEMAALVFVPPAMLNPTVTTAFGPGGKSGVASVTGNGRPART